MAPHHVTAPETKKQATRGLLKKMFSRHAPWWVKTLRTGGLVTTALIGIDRGLLPYLPGRPLTPGETTMLKEVYKDSIDYDLVRIHTSPAADVFLGWMGADAMTRKNLIFMQTTADLHDYAAKGADTYTQYTLTHEVAHVWQDQNDVMPNFVTLSVLNLSRFLPGDDHHTDYRYSVIEGKDLLQYNIEQQASIITDFHFASNGTMPAVFETNINAPEGVVRAGYEATLKNFRENPSYPGLRQ